MKDKIVYLDDEHKYPIIFTLNVMEKIQEEYGSLNAWKQKIFIDDENKEPEIKDILFGLTEMVNEGIEILNEENSSSLPYVTKKKVGRIITQIGLDGSIKKLGESIINANKTDTPKNE